MKRDMDLVRNILLTLEAEPSGYAPQTINIDGYTKDQIGYHIYLMIDGELLEGYEDEESGKTSPSAFPKCITWEGYEFLDACRDDKRWEQGKSVFNKLGGVTLDVAKQVLTRIMVKQASDFIS